MICSDKSKTKKNITHSEIKAQCNHTNNSKGCSSCALYNLLKMYGKTPFNKNLYNKFKISFCSKNKGIINQKSYLYFIFEYSENGHQ